MSALKPDVFGDLPRKLVAAIHDQDRDAASAAMAAAQNIIAKNTPGLLKLFLLHVFTEDEKQIAARRLKTLDASLQEFAASLQQRLAKALEVSHA